MNHHTRPPKHGYLQPARVKSSGVSSHSQSSARYLDAPYMRLLNDTMTNTTPQLENNYMHGGNEMPQSADLPFTASSPNSFVADVSSPAQTWSNGFPLFTSSSYNVDSQLGSQSHFVTTGDEWKCNNYYGRAQSSNIPLLTPPETPESSQEMGDTVLNAAEHRPIAAKPSEGGSDAGYIGNGSLVWSTPRDMLNGHASLPSAQATIVKVSEEGEQCQYCRRYFKALRRHKQSMHPEFLVSPMRRFDCPEANCNRKGFRKDNLTQHLRNVHGHIIPKRQRGGGSIVTGRAVVG